MLGAPSTVGGPQDFSGKIGIGAFRFSRNPPNLAGLVFGDRKT
jgi:hypothetical protein